MVSWTAGPGKGFLDNLPRRGHLAESERVGLARKREGEGLSRQGNSTVVPESKEKGQREEMKDEGA